jgi:hypothetical protein
MPEMLLWANSAAHALSSPHMVANSRAVVRTLGMAAQIASGHVYGKISIGGNLKRSFATRGHRRCRKPHPINCGQNVAEKVK